MSDYPEKLIPKPCYRIVDDESLMAVKGLWLVRHVEPGEKEMFVGNTQTLNPDCIEIVSNHLRDLSNNLLGVFEASDVCWGIAKPHIATYTRNWNGEELCGAPLPGHYFRDDRRGCYFIPVDPLLKERINVLNVSTGITETYRFKILHTPTVCNYWHVSIRVYNIQGAEVSGMPVGDKRKRRIWKAMKDYLVTSVVTTSEPETVTYLMPAIYCK